MTTSNSFNALQYLAANADLIAAFGTDTAAAAQHYAAYGQKEGRATQFDALGYVAANRDLIAAFGTDSVAAARHYITNGRAEGRTTAFDALGYLAANRDLIAAFGGDVTAATQHYIAYGYSEGRASSFDAESYLAANADLIEAFGDDPQAAKRHYVASGYQENRAVTFDAAGYLRINLDLLRTLGSDLQAAVEHYITYGYRESRPVPMVITSTTGTSLVTPTTAVPLEVGGNYAATALDSRMIKATLEANTTYSFVVSGERRQTAVLTLLDANGAQMQRLSDSVNEDNKVITFRPSAAGDYYLRVDTSNYAGTVSLVAGTVPADDYAGRGAYGGRLELGGDASGVIEWARDYDAFSLRYLRAGVTYRIEAVSNLRDGSAVTLSVDGQLGPVNTFTTMSTGQSNRSGILLTPTVGGDYTIFVNSPTSTGSYTLTAVRVPPARTDGQVTVGTPYNGSITHLESQDRTVWLDAGTTYTFLSQFERPGRNYLTLMNPDGIEVARDMEYDFNDKTFVFSPTQNGLYTLHVNAIDPGNYTLSAVVGDATPKDEYTGDSATTGRLSVGGSVSGAIQKRGDDDWFAITLEADTDYRFSLMTQRFSTMETAPLVQLFTADGKALSGMALYNGQPTKDTAVKSKQAGLYYVSVKGSFYQGGYTLSANTGDDYGNTTATAGRLTVGGSASGHGDYASDRDWFAVTLEAGSTYSFSASGPAANILTLFDQTGSPVGQYNYTAPQSGTYYLEHRSFSADHATHGWGDYTVTARRVASGSAMAGAADGMLAAF